MNKTLHTLAVALFLLSTTAAQAYPLFIKVTNPRNHAVFIHSDSRHTTHEIPPGEAREFVICGASDWHVRYSTGLLGNVKWTLNKKLDHFIENDCKSFMGDRWNENTVKYCTFRLDEAIGADPYALVVVEIRELATTAEQCNLSNNERATLVFPSVIPLVAAQALLAAKVLYVEKRRL